MTEMEVERTYTRKRSDMDPCGECPKGTCDHCHLCNLTNWPERGVLSADDLSSPNHYEGE